MSLSRSLSRAGALVLVTSVAVACGDSTSPLNLDPEEFRAVGESIALELENSAVLLTADGAMAEADPEPAALSLGSATSQRVLGGAMFSVARLRPKMQTSGESCGDPSQEPPTDTDGDGVPDNLTITFRLPDCHVVFEDGFMDMTGLFRISDPTPGTAGFALNFGMDNFRVVLDGPDGRITLNQDGTTSVSASASGLSQMQDWTQSASVAGFGSFGMAMDWTNTFAAAAGQSIVVGEPLPNGLFAANGTLRYNEGRRVAVLNVETVEPLVYDAACAAGYNEGTMMSPFADGVVDVFFSGDQGNGYVRISFGGCNEATVEFVNNSAI